MPNNDFKYLWINEIDRNCTNKRKGEEVIFVMQSINSENSSVSIIPVMWRRNSPLFRAADSF